MLREEFQRPKLDVFDKVDRLFVLAQSHLLSR